MSTTDAWFATGGRAARAARASQASKHVVVIASLTRSLVNFRLQLLAEMVAAGHKVTALAPDDDPDAIETLRKAGVGFRRIPMARTGVNPLSDLRTLAALYGRIRELSPDLTLAYTMKPIIYGGIAARLAGVRRRFALFTGFGYLFNERRNRLDAAAIRRLSIWLYRRALAGTEGAFVYNDADAEEIRRHRLLGAQTVTTMVAGSGVDLDRFAEVPPPAGPPVFLLIARMLREKGIAEFAEAARILKREFPAARFRILGPLDPSPIGLTMAEIQSWAAENVEYLGETKDVVPYLVSSTVFVLPSYYREGIPRSALEALATGRAIVTTDMPGCRETVVDGVNGLLVPPRDAAALAAAMRFFLEDETAASRMGASSRKLAEQRFDVRSVNRTLIGVLGLRHRE